MSHHSHIFGLSATPVITSLSQPMSHTSKPHQIQRCTPFFVFAATPSTHPWPHPPEPDSISKSDRLYSSNSYESKPHLFTIHSHIFLNILNHIFYPLRQHLSQGKLDLFTTYDQNFPNPKPHLTFKSHISLKSVISLISQSHISTITFLHHPQPHRFNN